MGDRLKIHLFTRDGGFVHAAEIPPFLVPPEVVQWGSRVFVLEKSGGPTAPCEYAEGLLYPLLEGVTSLDSVISRSVVRRRTAQQPGVYDAITARAEAAEARVQQLEAALKEIPRISSLEIADAIGHLPGVGDDVEWLKAEEVDAAVLGRPAVKARLFP